MTASPAEVMVTALLPPDALEIVVPAGQRDRVATGSRLQRRRQGAATGDIDGSHRLSPFSSEQQKRPRAGKTEARVRLSGVHARPHATS